MKKQSALAVLIFLIPLHTHAKPKKLLRAAWHLGKIVTGGTTLFIIYKQPELLLAVKQTIERYWVNYNKQGYAQRQEDKGVLLMFGAGVGACGMGVLDGIYGLYNVLTEPNENEIDLEINEYSGA